MTAKVTEIFLNRFFFDNYKCLYVPIEGRTKSPDVNGDSPHSTRGFRTSSDFFKHLQKGN